MAVNGKRKGKVGEQEACHYLKDLFGWSARRSQQFSGEAGDDDIRVDQTPSLFWEIKREQRLNVVQAIAKAVRQAGRRTAVLMHRPNRSEWLLTIRVSDLPALCHAYTIADQAHQLVAEELPD
jgi:hypothetical protein